MMRLADEPPGWRELCAKLQSAKKVDEFQAILDQINRLLTAHEKAHPGSAPKKVASKGKKSTRKRKAR